MNHRPGDRGFNSKGRGRALLRDRGPTRPTAGPDRGSSSEGRGSISGDLTARGSRSEAGGPALAGDRCPAPWTRYLAPRIGSPYPGKGVHHQGHGIQL